MFSKVIRRFSAITYNYSTFSHPYPLAQTSVLRDYEYVKAIEQSSSIDSFNLLLSSHFNNVILDIQTFKSVYQKMKQTDDSYHKVLFEVYNHSFKTIKSLEEFKHFCSPSYTRNANQNKQFDNIQIQSSEEKQTSPDSINQQPLTNKNKIVLQNLMKVIRKAGENGSNLVLNNVEIEFDYKYLYGNPLINEGIQQYGDEALSATNVDSNDVLSCMKSIRIGDVQFVKPQSNAKA